MKDNVSLKEFIEQYTPVTKPFLPPLDEFIPFLERIWETKWLTNNGEFHTELENELCNYLGVKFISLFSNGTLALITALQVLKITGEVITTPFSFIATAHSLWWNKIKPVFVDIESSTFNIDPDKIEAAITPGTTAILPVHVYGNPCEIEKINDIASKYGLKVIYDAAHNFGVRINNESILNFGDLSILSFHATKVFNTFEGGAIICHDSKTKERIDYLKNFGFAGEGTVIAPGINAKMNEFQAALGLLQLKYIDAVIVKRQIIAKKYRSELAGIPGITVLNDIPGVTHNYAYFPILVDEKDFGISRDGLYDFLKSNGIWSRKYFFPLVSSFSTYRSLPSSDKSNLIVANEIADKILCLPIYPDLEPANIEKIINIIQKSKK